MVQKGGQTIQLKAGEFVIPNVETEKGLPLRKPFPGFWQGLALGLMPNLTALLIVIPIVLVAFVGFKRNLDLSTWLPVFQFLAFLPAIFIGKAWGQKSWKDILPFKLIDWWFWPPFLLALAVVSLAVVGADAWVNHVFPEPAWLHRAVMGMGAITIVLIAPITEEPLCRGLILGGLLGRYSKGKAILFSALIFAIMHLNPWQFLPPLIIGLFFGWLVAETGSLWPPLVGHLLFNGLSVLAERWKIPYVSGQVLLPLWLWGIVFAFGGLAWLWLRHALVGREKHLDPDMAATSRL